MIVVIGNLLGRRDEAGGIEPAGFAATLASAAAASGSDVQVVARIGDDDIGDAVLLGLAARHVGHVATLRDAGRPTGLVVQADVENAAEDPEPTDDIPDGPTLDAADVGLALRYLADYRVIAITHTVDPDLVREASTAAAWAGAHLVIVTPPDTSQAPTLPDGALVISAEPDAEGPARRLGRYAAAVDSGESPNTAYAVLTEATTES